MAALKDLAINVSLHGKPGALALHGDFGVGKTTLLMKFNQEIREGKLNLKLKAFLLTEKELDFDMYLRDLLKIN